MVLVCSSCGIRYDPKLKLLRFPDDVERCNEWARLIDRPDLIDLPPGVAHKNYGLCNEHFLSKDFDGDVLRDDANPSIFDCRDNVPDAILTPDAQMIQHNKLLSTLLMEELSEDEESDDGLLMKLTDNDNENDYR